MVDELDVFLNVGTTPKKAGRLAYSRREDRSLFEYDREFLGSGFSISPIQLPLEDGVFRADRPRHPDDHLYGLHGVFADSLPDTWGRKVQDLWFQKIGIESPHPLDRLAYIGAYGLGALSYEPAMKFKEVGKTVTELSQLRKTAIGVLKGDVSSVTARLSRIGGSAGGMHPKYLVNYHPLAETCTYGIPPAEDEIPAIIKVPLRRGEEAQRIEHAYSCMAQDAHIIVPRSFLLSHDGFSYYLVRRFDIRDDGSRNHVHTLAGMLGINYADRIIDYRQAFRLTKGLTRDNRQLEQLYRRMAFNILSCNRDDHSKNMSYIMDSNGAWRLSPAYDLTYATEVRQGHSMSLNGVTAEHTMKDFEVLAGEFGIRHWSACIQDVDNAVLQWPEYAAKAGISKKTTAAIKADMRKTRATLHAVKRG